MNKFNTYFQNIVNEAYVFGEADEFKNVYPAEHTTGNLLRAIGELIMGRVGVKRARVITQIVKNALYLNDADLNDILNITNQKEKQKTPGDPTEDLYNRSVHSPRDLNAMEWEELRDKGLR